MDKNQRKAAVFGSFDGLVGHTGLIFGLLLGHAPVMMIALGGLGGGHQQHRVDGYWRVRK